MTETAPPYRYVDSDDFCLSARLLPDLDAGGVTDTLSITIEGSDEPQSVHVPAAGVPAVAAGIVAAAGHLGADQPNDPEPRRPFDARAGLQRLADEVARDSEEQAAAGPELTAEEARDLADDLGTDLYRAQDALAFIGECCDIADREQRPVTTADVREWLKGARCGRQLAADAADRAGLRKRIAEALIVWNYRGKDPEHGGILKTVRANAYSRADAVLAVLPAPTDRATVLLRSAEVYLSALHAHASRHDHLGEGHGCAGCELRDQIAAELRRVAAEEQQPESYRPARGDAVEQWLKTRRNISTSHSDWHVLDSLLDQYRLHADTGTPLGEHACDGPHCECAEAQPNAADERCDVTFESGARCTKRAGHRSPTRQDPHTPGPDAEAQQPETPAAVSQPDEGQPS